MAAEHPLRLIGLRRRGEFVAVARDGRRWVTPAFVLQAATRPGSTAEAACGIGFTASRRVGKAVARNRARRRLREAARRVMPGCARPGMDYVIVARPAALTWPYQRLCDDLSTALARVHTARPRGRASFAAPPSSP